MKKIVILLVLISAIFARPCKVERTYYVPNWTSKKINKDVIYRLKSCTKIYLKHKTIKSEGEQIFVENLRESVIDARRGFYRNKKASDIASVCEIYGQKDEISIEELNELNLDLKRATYKPGD